jgi:flagellar hook-associated protein 3 FlgL
MDSGTVVNASLVTGNNYTISFAVAAGVTTYNVQNTTTATSAATGTLTSPGTITFDGQQVGVTGAPANGDTFNVAPAAYQSIFQSMADAITALNAPGQSPSGRALYGTAVQSLNATMQGALIHLTAQRADVGTKLSELDAYQQVNDGRSLEFQTQISGLEDLDMVAGATKVSQNQITFQAALQSYSSVSKLSLFNYM